MLTAQSVQGAESERELAKKIQNPASDMISVPFQNNFNYGPNNDVQSLLNIQPVIPIHLNKNWNLVTRTIIPLINQPWPESRFGLGDINTTPFLSPPKLLPVAEGGLFWGVGPILQFPTATESGPNIRFARRSRSCSQPFEHRAKGIAHSIKVKRYREQQTCEGFGKKMML